MEHRVALSAASSAPFASNQRLILRRAPIGIAIELLPALLFVAILYMAISQAEHIPGYASSSAFQNLKFIIGAARYAIVLEGVRRYLNEQYLLTHSHILRRAGILSTRYSTSSIAYRDIREVRLDQKLHERMLNYGTILLGTASVADYEMCLVGVGRPDELCQALQRRRGAGLEGREELEYISEEAEPID